MFGTRSRSGLRGPAFFCLTILATWAASVAQPLYARERAGSSQPAPVYQQAVELPRIPLQVGARPITVEVAADDASRAKGLMFREELAPDHGMLFVFPEAAQLCFWMKNTPLPLTVAFIDAAGAIINLADMQPQSLEAHCSMAPALYALEMEQGWFTRRGANPGTRVQGLPRLLRHTQ